MEIQIPIEANVNDDRRTSGTVKIVTFNPAQKMQNALKKLGIFWGASILSILVPVLHFVLVPLFFFLGIFMAWRAYGAEGKVLSGTTTCPHCQTPLEIKTAELHWPLSEICQSCARVVRIEKV